MEVVDGKVDRLLYMPSRSLACIHSRQGRGLSHGVCRSFQVRHDAKTGLEHLSDLVKFRLNLRNTHTAFGDTVAAMEGTQFKAFAESLLKDSSLADFEISCGSDTYQVHRVILACHSQYFKSLFEGKFSVG